MRKTILLLTFSALGLSGCMGNQGYGYNGYNNGNVANSAAVRTVGGAAAGAVIAEATGGSRTQGALMGAVVGGGSCAFTNNCR